MVYRAPRIETVLPSLLEFMGDAVFVGHNVRFDLVVRRRRRCAATAARRSPTSPSTPSPLARRLLRDEVPNCRLGTLAERYRLRPPAVAPRARRRPRHRRPPPPPARPRLAARRLGPRRPPPAAHPRRQRARRRSSSSPTACRARRASTCSATRRGRVLYVGKATNLRARVRQYFSTDERRKIGALLRETERIDHKRCATELEAAVLENRLIHHLEPRYNRQGTRWRKSAYLKLTLAERYPRLSVVRQVARRRRAATSAHCRRPGVAARWPRRCTPSCRSAAAPAGRASGPSSARASPRSSACRCARAPARSTRWPTGPRSTTAVAGLTSSPVRARRPAVVAHGPARHRRALRGGGGDPRPAGDAARCALAATPVRPAALGPPGGGRRRRRRGGRGPPRSPHPHARTDPARHPRPRRRLAGRRGPPGRPRPGRPGTAARRPRRRAPVHRPVARPQRAEAGDGTCHGEWASPLPPLPSFGPPSARPQLAADRTCARSGLARAATGSRAGRGEGALGLARTRREVELPSRRRTAVADRDALGRR